MHGKSIPESPAIRLWDLPVRLVHWSFVALLPALWWSAETGRLDLHQTLGLVMLALVAFRLLWGAVGSETARFSAFLRGPRAVMGYVKGLRGGGHAPAAGHNPLGGWSVLTLLGLLAVQVTLGLFAQDTDAVGSGPLNHRVSWDTAEALTEAHELGFNLILAFVALHLAAIFYYRVIRRDDLVRPMLTGRRTFPSGTAEPRMAPLWRAGACAAVAAALAWWLSFGAPLPGEEPLQDSPAAAEGM